MKVLPLFLLILLGLLPEGSNGFKIEIERIDPRTFNVLTDIFAEFTSVLFGLAVAYLYGILLSFHLRGGRTIPAKMLGGAPPDVFAALWKANGLGWSWPAIVTVLLLAFNLASYSIADSGNEFITLQLKGKDMPVLTLDPNQRDTNLLFEAAGDPPNTADTLIEIDKQADPNLTVRTRICK